MSIKFMDEVHETFFQNELRRDGSEGDVYRRAMFYALGLTDTTRRHIEEIYDFAHRGINFSALRKPWQTSTSLSVTRLAFNLYNGYAGRGKTDPAEAYTPYELCGCGLMEYILEAIRIRYPEYTAEAQDSTRQMFETAMRRQP